MATDGAAIGEIRFERTDPNAPPTAFPLELLFTSEPLSIQVHPDDVIFVPAGTIHAIGPGLGDRRDPAAQRHGLPPLRPCANTPSARFCSTRTTRRRCSRAPPIRPEPNEREGHVPNVVYTCGAIRHGSRIVLP